MLGRGAGEGRIEGTTTRHTTNRGQIHAGQNILNPLLSNKKYRVHRF
jgi:hypothetical protein